MNYKESLVILKAIKKAEKILINCHSRPDVDSVGSALGLYEVLKEMKKDVSVVCPNLTLDDFNFLSSASKIQKVDYKKFNFSDYEIFICIDSSSWSMVVGKSLADLVPIPGIPLVVIDHHKTNKKFGNINLIDENSTSASEIVYLIFKDWGIEINSKVATALLAGIVGDTGAFQYPGVSGKTFDTVKELMEKGADKDEIIQNIYRSVKFDLLKFWGEVLRRMEIDDENGFVWSAIPYEAFNEYKKPKNGKETAASSFTQIVEGTEFGMVMVEEEKDSLSISLRSRTGFDTTKIVKVLGGGGHVYASGAKIEGIKFEDAVKKVLKVAREVVNENRRKN